MHECATNFRRHPFQPSCSCGWQADVFYPDGYWALRHWREHEEDALGAPAGQSSRKFDQGALSSKEPPFSGIPAGCSQTSRGTFPSRAAGAPNA